MNTLSEFTKLNYDLIEDSGWFTEVSYVTQSQTADYCTP